MLLKSQLRRSAMIQAGKKPLLIR